MHIMAQVTPYKTKYIQKRQSLKNYSLSLIFLTALTQIRYLLLIIEIP